MTPSPDITVVLCTYNRADRVERAVRAILGQEAADLELVVVDDGSTDDTAAVLGSIDDERMRVIRRPNGGLSAARNTGLAAARGDWVVFIDDDDLAEPAWLATFLDQTSDPTVGIACSGATFVDSQGDELFTHLPRSFGEPFGDVVGSSLAGTFATRSDLVRAAGGYLDGLAARHQSELFIRLLAVARDWGLRMASAPGLMVRIEARTATDRPSANPRRLYDSTRWILARHGAAFTGQRAAVARFESVAGINAARLGEWRSARRHLLRAARSTPRSLGTWGRLALASVPAVGQRVWNRHGEAWATNDAGEIGVLHQSRAHGDANERELFLAWRYQENPPASGASDPPSSTEAPAGAHRAPVVRLAARLVRKRGWDPVIHVACGPGDDSGSVRSRPGAVLCLDVIERVDDPVGLLLRLADIADGAPVLLSTPDRSLADPGRPVGPPTTARHRREWTYDQFELLLLSTGFDIERSWHVTPRPPSGSSDGRRTRGLSRISARRVVRGRRSCMVFLVRERAT